MDTHPENTLAAFREALRLGVHMIEIDVRMTKDGHLVILHDETVDRTSNGEGKISDMARLKQQDIRINYCCTDDLDQVRTLFNRGVDFILTDKPAKMLEAAATAGIKPAQY
jgi:glycerophosphoryl diester phosphodiesterase